MGFFSSRDPKAANKFVDALGNTNAKIQRLGMSPRQLRLNHLLSIYCCEQYAPFSIDFDGSKRVDRLEIESVSSKGYIPPGFYDAGGQMLPLKFRRPTAPYHLGRAIVNRFTGLLFSEKRHPMVDQLGDDDTDEYTQALIKGSRLWSKMIEARNLGGAMGSVCVSFQFHNGKPLVEVHDPRWCKPTFKDRATFELASIENRAMVPKDIYDPDKKVWETVPYWTRRIIDDTSDIVFQDEPVGNGDEPNWTIESQVDHNFGFCPAVWIQNTPCSYDIDGDADYKGLEDQLDSMDRLIATAYHGVLKNADPTLILKANQEIPTGLNKGSNNAIQLPVDGSAEYMEINGAGAKACVELADKLRSQILEVAQCVLEHPADGLDKTATEVMKQYDSMIAKADVLREQYGEHGIKPLLDMMLRAAEMKTKTVAVEGQGLVKGAIILPPRVENGKIVPHVLGSLDVLTELKWPRYFETSPTEVVQAVAAATNAKTGGVIDGMHATQFVAEYFQIENPAEVAEAIAQEKAEQQAQLMASAMTSQPYQDSGSTEEDVGGETTSQDATK